VAGKSGAAGPVGKPGDKGVDSTRSGHVIVRHSQDPRQPYCPQGFKEMWKGFSLMYTVGNGRSHMMDLGKSGSCVKKFSPMPFLYCSIATGGCKYASRNDYSYWLAAENTNQPPVSNSAIQPFISKCVVCEAQSQPITMHSQAVTEPACPLNYESLWTGYSFMMTIGKGKTGAGQQLSSPGSCMPKFRSAPFIECQGGAGTCAFSSSKYSYWLAIIQKANQFKVPVQKTLAPGVDVRKSISRCRVCMRRRKR